MKIKKKEKEEITKESLTYLPRNNERKRNYMVIAHLPKFERWKETEGIKEIKNKLIKKVQKYIKSEKIIEFVFQPEKGGEQNRLHLQIFIILKETTTPTALVSFFLNHLGLQIRPPFAILKGKVKDARRYCLKTGTRYGEPFDSGKEYEDEEYSFPYNKLQIKILDLIEKTNRRQILFIIDELGGIGKSYIVSKEWGYTLRGAPQKRNYTIYLDHTVDLNKVTEFITCEYFNAIKEFGIDLGKERVTIFVDIPLGKKMDARQFAATLEMLKSGRLRDTRNRYRRAKMLSPRIAVFLNREIPGLTIDDKKGERYLIRDRCLTLRIPDHPKIERRNKGANTDLVLDL